MKPFCEHLWDKENEDSLGFVRCKRCDAVGEECYECSGEGCAECSQQGVIEVPQTVG